MGKVSKTNHRSLTFNEKAQLIKDYEQSPDKNRHKILSERYQVARNTVYAIIKSKDKILNSLQSVSNWNRKRLSKSGPSLLETSVNKKGKVKIEVESTPDSQLDEMMVAWFKRASNANILIPPDIVDKKAGYFASLLGIECPSYRHRIEELRAMCNPIVSPVRIKKEKISLFNGEKSPIFTPRTSSAVQRSVAFTPRTSSPAQRTVTFTPSLAQKYVSNASPVKFHLSPIKQEIIVSPTMKEVCTDAVSTLKRLKELTRKVFTGAEKKAINKLLNQIEKGFKSKQKQVMKVVKQEK